MIQDNASFTFLYRIADVDRGKIRHLSKVLLGDVSLVAELLSRNARMCASNCMLRPSKIQVCHKVLRK